MDNTFTAHLIASDIHGFRAMDDLDIPTMMDEAKSRWLRPNEIHAILCNYKYFTVHVKPINLPRSGTIVLFDRKKLRNFRKDGHNWKKKKDGKTVKEAHEHLKVGNEERIHVYYAHGEDNLTFVRRCYWLLDKSLEHIVLVHYRETQESQGSPGLPVNSSPSSGISDLNASWPLSEEADLVVDPSYVTTQRAQLQTNDSSNIESHEMRLLELNTLEWDELVVPANPSQTEKAEEGKKSFTQQNQLEVNGYRLNDYSPSTTSLPEQSIEERLPGKIAEKVPFSFNIPDDLCFQLSRGQIISEAQQYKSQIMGADSVDGFRNLEQDALKSQDSFGQWINSIITDSPASVDNPILESSITTNLKPFTSTPLNENQLSTLGRIFSITDISHSWAPSSEETKILVVGVFHQVQPLLPKFNMYCVCGRACVPAEEVQPGVFRCLISPQAPGLVNLFLSFDGQEPISQPVTFEFRAPLVHNWMVPSEDKFSLEEFKFQMRLARLLFSSSKILNVLSCKVSPNSLKEAKKFARKTSHVIDNWPLLMKSIEDSKISSPQAKDNLFELMLQHRLWDWLLERVIEGSMLSERDEHGQGVIHLCAILGYTWSVYPFEWAGLSLDYRDKFGWTALHWAAYYGRAMILPRPVLMLTHQVPQVLPIVQKSGVLRWTALAILDVEAAKLDMMIATLQSAGAKSYLVTDPTSGNPGGLTAADLASKNGYEGLAAFLAEKALVEHFRDMKLAGNADGSLQTTTNDTVVPGNFTQEELHLKDTLAAYRTAADAAARIHTAFREHSLKVQTKAVESSNPEIDARNIVAAMKIQHAFRNFETRKVMAAAARIQYRFRTWKMRKDFLNMRRQTIKIQSIFRGFQVRRHYKKITWSVGVLEKAILRWRLKRKGFRGLQVNINEEDNEQKQENCVEEDFFQASRKQAEERVERSVVKVQAMFRSKRAQEEYRRMKLEHNKASAEYEGLVETDMDMS